MTHGVARALVLAVGVSLHAGCAGLNQSSYSDRFVLHPEMKNAPPAESTGAPAPAAPAQTSLEEAIAKVRTLMAEAKPDPKTQLATLESRDPELTAAIAAAKAFPSPRHYVDVAAIYHRHHVLDKAYDYNRMALSLSPHDGDAYEGLARVWRDWKAPQLGIGDAYRAVAFEPMSPSAQNTLGTVLQALGDRAAARRAYKRAALLDPKADYAFNNLCYLSYVEGKTQQAIAECQSALRLNPAMIAAHNNLGLVHAAAGRADLARNEFALAAGPVATSYNMGMAYLAQQRFKDAAREFDAAKAMNPDFLDARRRAKYAHQRALETEKEANSYEHDGVN
jgi:Flp pilus assembly protein TadD